MMMERCCKRYELFPTRWQTSGKKNVPARLPLCFQPSFLLTWSIVAVWHQNASLIHNSPRERKRGAGKTKERGREREREGRRKKTQRKEQNKVWVKVWRKKGKNKDKEKKLGSRREEGGIARRGYTVWAKKMMIKERKSRLRLSDVAFPRRRRISEQPNCLFFFPLLACHR